MKIIIAILVLLALSSASNEILTLAAITGVVVASVIKLIAVSAEKRNHYEAE